MLGAAGHLFGVTAFTARRVAISRGATAVAAKVAGWEPAPRALAGMGTRRRDGLFGLARHLPLSREGGSTAVASATNFAWLVDVNLGTIFHEFKPTALYVRAVRAGDLGVGSPTGRGRRLQAAERSRSIRMVRSSVPTRRTIAALSGSSVRCRARTSSCGST